MSPSIRADERRRDDVLKAAGVEIGRDLEHERPARLRRVARLDHPGDQVVQRLAPLQVAQTRRVRRGDVDRQIVGEGREGSDAERIILDPVGRILVGAEVHANQARRPPPEPGASPFEAGIVEAEAVDDRGVLQEPEQPRTGVAS